MLKKLFSGKAEFVYLTVILILLALIAVYNWVIAALACILIAGVSVLTHKSDTVSFSIGSGLPFRKMNGLTRLWKI